MQKLVLSLFLLILLPTGIAAQTDYSSQELEVFVEIYMNAKNRQDEAPEKLKTSLAKYDVSSERYAEILRGQLLSEKIILTNAEESFVGEMKMNQAEVKINRKEYLEKQCKQKGLSFEKYNKILNRYNSEIKFQRSLQVYFNSFLQKQK